MDIIVKVIYAAPVPYSWRLAVGLIFASNKNNLSNVCIKSSAPPSSSLDGALFEFGLEPKLTQTVTVSRVTEMVDFSI